MNMQRRMTSVFLSAILLSVSAHAQIEFDSVGIVADESVVKFSGTHHHGLIFGYRIDSASERFWMPNRLALTVGRLERGADSAAFVSVGPSYRWPTSSRRQGSWFVDIGVHPTYLSQSKFRGKDMGGKLHFTSHIAIGTFLDRRRSTSVAFRYQHTSNAGLEYPNPGIDMLGLSVSYNFGRNENLFHADKADETPGRFLASGTAAAEAGGARSGRGPEPLLRTGFDGVITRR